MEIDPIKAITQEIESAAATDYVGMLTIKTANRTLHDAKCRPDPDPLYKDLWYEGEVCCLFSDSNLGKSIYAVQIAEEIAYTRNVLLVDCELSDKQFQLRYTDKETGVLHKFPEKLFRAEINPMRFEVKDYEDKILKHIEEAMHKFDCRVAIIDNLTYLCNGSDKSDEAGSFMMKLMHIKKMYGWSLMVVAHTPKRSLNTPISRNDLAGSSRLFNFFDCVFAIGNSALNKSLRYIKQLKVRAGEFRYGADNVIVCEVDKTGGYLHFTFKEYGSEYEHLRDRSQEDTTVRDESVKALLDKGRSYRQIAEELGIGKSTVCDIARRIKQQGVVRPAADADASDTSADPVLAGAKDLFD